jgi:hypothetical protein
MDLNLFKIRMPRLKNSKILFQFNNKEKSGFRAVTPEYNITALKGSG